MLGFGQLAGQAGQPCMLGYGDFLCVISLYLSDLSDANKWLRESWFVCEGAGGGICVAR